MNQLSGTISPNQTLADVAVHIPPRNPVELQLTQMWEQLLGIEPISVTDNFFELGGDSLLALRLFTQIEQRFGQKLSLATLLEAPAVEQLARVLNQAGESDSWSSLVPIQPSGSKPSFFCVHGQGANVLVFKDLARYLGSEQPFYGLQARGLDGKQPPLSRIEDIAAYYIQEVRTVQPQGPYFLAGYSSGGLIAFEMAQQLHRQGEKIAFLAVFDTFVPGCFKPVSFPEYWARQWRNFFRFGPKHPARMMKKSLERKSSHATIRLYQSLGIPLPSSLQRVNLYWSLLQAVLNYVPQVYPGRLILFRATDEPGQGWYYYPAGMATPDDWHSRDPEYGWGSLAGGGLEIHDVPGRHDTILKEPRVETLAEMVQACLEQSRQMIE